MKKLLAAVTSFAMSASLMTSAFASSFNVSAAGSISAVQPNVSIGEVADVAVNKTAQADFVVTPEEVTIAAGSSERVRLYADAGSHKVGTFVIELNDKDLPGGITATVADSDLRCRAVSGNFTFEKLNGKYYCDTLDAGEPMEVDSTKAVIAFTLSVPAGLAAGDYTYNLTEFHVVEDGYNGVEFDATIKPGVIHVTGEGNATTTGGGANTTQAPNTTKAPDPSLNIDNGFIITPEDVTVEAGQSINIGLYATNTSNRKAGSFVTQVIDANLPIPGATATMTSVRCTAVSTSPSYEELNGTWYCDTLDAGEPQEIDTTKPVARFNITVPAGTEPGVYTWYPDRFHVVEDGYNGVEFDANIKGGKITVTSGGDAPTTSTTKSGEGDKPVEVDEGFIIQPEDVEVEAGSSITIGLYATNNSNRKAGAFVAKVVDANLPIAGATATMTSTRCQAVSGNPSYEEIEGTWYCDCLDGGEPQEIDTTKPVARFTISIPAGTTPGTYEWKPDRFHVVEDGYNAIEFDANIKSGKIIVKGADDVPTTTTTTIASASTTTIATTTTAPTTAPSTSTTAPKAEGSAKWVIPTKTVKAGDEVTLNVAVDGANTLAIAGAQFKVTADAPVEYSGVGRNSAAYGAAVVGNGATNEFAFGEGAGKGVVGADGATVISLTYKVPAGTPAGTYNVKWSDAFISDTNGNSLTADVTLVNGAIIVEDATPDGNISWKIPTVHAAAGETVQLEVAVEDTENAALPIAGAQFGIKAATPIEFAGVSERSAGYAAAIVNNKDTNEFAFGEGAGKGVAAANGSNVLVLTYTVPSGTAAGTYPVTWNGEIFISDTNGSSLTDQVHLIDGAIIVDDTTADGSVTWTIPEKHAKAGETVELDVLVTTGGNNLAVAGAQFVINQKAPIAFASATGSDAYNSELVYNEETLEFAFGQGKGAGVEAANRASVLKLTYTVPDGTEPGVYPVEWANAFISDTNGKEITSSVTLVNGAIIIDEPAVTTASTTAPSGSTTEDLPVTTTTAVPVPAGAVVWQIQRVTAAAGETVEVPVIVVDPNGANLPIGGAQFGVTAKAPIAYSAISGTSAAYGSKIVANPSTLEFAFADAKGAETAGANGAAVFTLTYTVPEGTAAGEYPVEWNPGFFSVSSADGADMTSQIVCIDGAIIVTEPDAPTSTDTTAPHSEGAVIWQAQTVTVAPGEEATLDVLVIDPNGANLEIGGAQFVINNEGDIALTGGTGTDAYGVGIQSGVDGDANRFAFAHPKGEGVAAANGAKVITLTFKVAETAADGTYPVTIDELNVSDTNGLDITNHVLALPGAIIVKTPVATTTTTDGPDIPVTTTTTPYDIPEGAIGWELDHVKGQPGDSVTLTMTILDPHNTAMEIGGGQFKLVTDPTFVSAQGTPYQAALVFNTETSEFAFADAKGNGVKSVHEAVMMTVRYTIPADAAAGTIYPVEFSGLVVSDGTGTDISEYVVAIPGSIEVLPSDQPIITTTDNPAATTTTTTSTTAVPGSSTTTTGDPGSTTTTTTTTKSPEGDSTVVASEVTVVDGYYFNHDPRSFNAGHVESLKLVSVDSETGKAAEIDTDASLITFKERVSGEDNPMGAYREEQTNFTYIVDVYYDGEILNDAEGNPVSFKAYIGVKGDSNLDNKADAKDASNALGYYAKVSTKFEDESADDIRLNPDANEIINDNPDLDLDQFGAFLVDVNKDVYDEDNWKTTKSGRTIDATDASAILKYYSIVSTGTDDRQAAWNESIIGREEKIADYLAK